MNFSNSKILDRPSDEAFIPQAAQILKINTRENNILQTDLEVVNLPIT